MRGEPSIDLANSLCIGGRVLLLDRASAESIRAQTVENGRLKSTHGRHLRVYMQWVPVVAQAIEEGLVSLGHLFLDEVGFPVGNLGNL